MCKAIIPRAEKIPNADKALRIEEANVAAQVEKVEVPARVEKVEEAATVVEKVEEVAQVEKVEEAAKVVEKVEEVAQVEKVEEAAKFEEAEKVGQIRKTDEIVQLVNKDTIEENEKAEPNVVLPSFGENASTETMIEEQYISPLINFMAECVNEHNRLRALHGCQPLEVDDALCEYATERAKRLAHKGLVEHSKDNPYGENIYVSSEVKVDGECVAQGWYREMDSYDFTLNHLCPGTEHFTQVIWADTKKIGIGLAQSKHNEAYVVVNYYPPGNVQGQFHQNVPELLEHQTINIE